MAATIIETYNLHISQLNDVFETKFIKDLVEEKVWQK